MAIDSLIKRKSAVGARRIAYNRRYLPVPTGAAETEDREQVLWDYIGVLADPPVPPPDTTLRMDHRILANRRY
jgi:hypothetical protein